MSAPLPVPDFPTLQEILQQNLPPVFEDGAPDSPLLDKLPSALSLEYVQNLLDEDGVKEFGFLEKKPPEIIEAVRLRGWTVTRPECIQQCQRLAVLAAFCAFWLKRSIAWGFLDYATYEPVYGSYEKPTGVYVLRARAALTDFTKRHRAIKDLNRLIELDPANRTLYRAEIQRRGRQYKKPYPAPRWGLERNRKPVFMRVCGLCRKSKCPRPPGTLLPLSCSLGESRGAGAEPPQNLPSAAAPVQTVLPLK